MERYQLRRFPVAKKYNDSHGSDLSALGGEFAVEPSAGDEFPRGPMKQKYFISNFILNLLNTFSFSIQLN